MKHSFPITKAIALCALCAAMLTPMARAQKFEVTQVKQVAVASKVYHPLFVPGSHQILVSGEDYTGLGVINLADNSYKSLIDGRAAGYRPGGAGYRPGGARSTMPLWSSACMPSTSNRVK